MHLWTEGECEPDDPDPHIPLWRCFIPVMARRCGDESTGASLVQLPVLPWDRLPFISPSPQGSQQQTTDRGRGERNIEEEKKGSFGRGGGELVHSQLQVNPVCLSKFGWCFREPRVNITLFFPLLPEVMDVKQRRFLHARQSTILFILSLIRFAASNGTGLDEDVETS